MRIDVLDYYTKEDWLAIKQEANQHPTPFLVVNLDIVRRKYEELLHHFPFAKIYYAVKANPAVEVLELLRTDRIRQALMAAPLWRYFCENKA